MRRSKLKVREIDVTVSAHQWRIVTDTGYTQAHWAITQRGLLYQLRSALRSCGVPVELGNVRMIVDNARREGYVTLVYED